MWWLAKKHMMIFFPHQWSVSPPRLKSTFGSSLCDKVCQYTCQRSLVSRNTPVSYTIPEQTTPPPFYHSTPLQSTLFMNKILTGPYNAITPLHFTLHVNKYIYTGVYNTITPLHSINEGQSGLVVYSEHILKQQSH